MGDLSRPDLLAGVIGEIREKGYLGPESMERLSRDLLLPPARIYGFSTQFGEFPLQEVDWVARVCLGPACFHRGGRELWEEVSGRTFDRGMVLPEPALAEWHFSPAVEITYADGGSVLLQGEEAVNPRAWPTARSGVGGGRPSPRWRRPPDSPPPDWLEALREDPGGTRLFRESVQKALRDRDGMLDILGRRAAEGWCPPSFREMAEVAGSSPPPLPVVDLSGVGEENDVHRALARLFPDRVVAGGLLFALLAGAARLVFYCPWRYGGELEETRDRVKRILHRAGDVNLPAVEVVAGPINLPASRGIALASLLEGEMIRETASRYHKGEVRVGGSPLLVVKAGDALLLSWILDGGNGEGGAPRGGVVAVGGDVPRPFLLEVPAGKGLEETVRSLEGDVGTGSAVLLQRGGLFGEPVFPGEKAGEGGVVDQAVLVDVSRPEVEWAGYLAEAASARCCGGCVPGRTAPAVLRSLLAGDGKSVSGEVEGLEEVLDLSASLALCPRLGEILHPLRRWVRRLQAGKAEPVAAGGAAGRSPTAEEAEGGKGR